MTNSVSSKSSAQASSSELVAGLGTSRAGSLREETANGPASADSRVMAKQLTPALKNYTAAAAAAVLNYTENC